jgi:NRPS condensation-like uncharacterized protein
MANQELPPEIPRRFPVVIEDDILYWMRNSHDSEIRGVITLKGRLDKDRLSRALRLCMDAEPILGCRFKKRLFRPYWERMDDLDKAASCELVETADYDADIGPFLTSLPPLDLFAGPQVRIWILRSTSDIIVFKMQHVVGDGGACAEFIHLLSEIYTKLCENPDYRPTPNIGRGTRSLNQVGDNFSFRDKYGIVSRGMKDIASFMMPFKYWFYPFGRHERTGHVLIVSAIEPRRFRAIKNYGRTSKATVNDMMLALFLRAFYQTINTNPESLVRVVATVNLRRYTKTGRAGALCNLSGFNYLDIGKNIAEPFDRTLSKVQKHMTSFKGDYIGMGQFFITIPLFKLLPFPVSLWMHDRMGNMQKKQTRTEGRVAPLYTNVGTIKADHISFGGCEVADSFVTTTVPWPPVLALCITTFRERMTMTVGFCETCVTKKDARILVDHIQKQVDNVVQLAESMRNREDDSFKISKMAEL